MEAHEIIQYPILTEKSNDLRTNNQFSFWVHPKATKFDIKYALNKLFNVDVVNVNTTIVKGKLKKVRYEFGYRKNRKKAIVSLKKGQNFDFFEGIK